MRANTANSSLDNIKGAIARGAAPTTKSQIEEIRYEGYTRAELP